MLLNIMEFEVYGLVLSRQHFERVNKIFINAKSLIFLLIAALTATQCVTYDHAKRFWARVTGWSEGIKLHLGASLITGFVG
jgi:hypothetical protein